MDFVLIIIVGFLSGILYTRDIYRRSKRGKNPLLTFPIRFTLLGVVLFLIGKHFGEQGLIVFSMAHLVAVFLFVSSKVFENRKL